MTKFDNIASAAIARNYISQYMADILHYTSACRVLQQSSGNRSLLPAFSVLY